MLAESQGICIIFHFWNPGLSTTQPTVALELMEIVHPIDVTGRCTLEHHVPLT